MGCFGQQPTYNPPAPPTLPTAGDLYNQANSFWQNTNPTLYNAQSNAVKNSTDPNYYNSFQPSSFQSALGNQYFKNVWPDTQAFMKNQLSQSGMINSPGASQAMGNTLGNIETGIGQYLSGIGQQQANTGIQAGLGVPLSGLLNPFVQTGQQQTTNQANLDYGYQQAQAQQQYQQAMNQYQQQAAFANTLGQISPIGGAIYGASSGNLGNSLSGTMQSYQSMLPFLMMQGGGMGNMFGSGGGGSSALGGYSPQTFGSTLMGNGGGTQSVY